MKIMKLLVAALFVGASGCGVEVAIDSDGDQAGSGGASSSTASSSSSVASTSVSASSSTGVGGGGGASSSSSVASSSGVGGGQDDQDAGVDADGGFLQPIITVELSGTVKSNTFVKKSLGVPAVAFKVTTAELAKLKTFTLTGQAKLVGSGCDWGQQCAREAFVMRVSSVSVYDEADQQVGWGKAPDPKTGKSFIGNVNVMESAGSAKTFTVKVALSSMASDLSPYDQIAIGIEQPWEVENTDANDKSILADVKPELKGQLGPNPSVVITILNRGEAVASSEVHPSSKIVIGGKDEWVIYAKYWVHAEYEDLLIDRARLFQASSDGDNADFTVIAIGANGQYYETVLPAQNVSNAADVDLSAKPIFVPKGDTAFFGVMGKMAAVISSAAANGAWHGVPRSGHMPALGLASSYSPLKTNCQI